jgi:hypothetical protein
MCPTINAAVFEAEMKGHETITVSSMNKKRISVKINIQQFKRQCKFLFINLLINEHTMYKTHL